MHKNLRPYNINAHIIQIVKCFINGMSHGKMRSTPNNCLYWGPQYSILFDDKYVTISHSN